VDKEVLMMINNSYATATKLLEDNREALDRIADYLFEHETITGKEFMKIFRELKNLPDPDEKKNDNDKQNTVEKQIYVTESEVSGDKKQETKVPEENTSINKKSITDDMFVDDEE